MAGYQVLGIRSFSKFNSEKNRDEIVRYDAFFERRWRFENFNEVLIDPGGLLDRLGVPEEERENLYYTVAHCGDEKRVIDFQDILPFDIDEIGANADLPPDQIFDLYAKVVTDAIGADLSKTGVVFSGNGLHFLIHLSERIHGKEFFKENKAQYKALLGKINRALESAGLPGKPDPAVFDAARILRFPTTWNIKPDKRNPGSIRRVQAVVLHSQLEVQDYSLEEKSGLKKLGATDAIPKNKLKRYRKGPGEEALRQCLFLKHCDENQAKILEPEWYSAASIVGCFSNGRELFHEMSKGHPGYTVEGTNAKLDQALGASGPRTCTNIDSQWDGCRACPHWGGIISPVVIQNRDVIASEVTGFYDYSTNKDGKESKVPNFIDLLKAFKRDTHYFHDGHAEKIYGWTGTHYREWAPAEISHFCEIAMAPPPTHRIRQEFKAKVESNYLKLSEELEHFFYETTLGKLNLKNGVLDIATGSLFPHSEDFGFRYVLPYAYDEMAKAPKFEKFLDEITLGRDDFKQTLLEFMGYCLWPEYDDHCYLWLSGSGRNGKSTFSDILRKMLGSSNCASVSLDQFEDGFSLDTMNHKLLNISEESDRNKIETPIMAQLKKLSSGAGILVAAKYERPYTMRCAIKQLIISQREPTIPASDDATRSRLILVPFDLRLEDGRGDGKSLINTRLTDDLAGELPGILNLAIAALRGFLAKSPRKIHRGAESLEALNEVLRDSDTVERWLQDCVDLVPDSTTPAALEGLYANYKSTVDDGYAVPMNFFSARLRGKYGKRIRISRERKGQGIRKQVVYGISLNSAQKIEF